jgi:hypothetical protein
MALSVVTTQEKFKVQTSAGKVMASIFWDSEGILLVEFLDRGATINSERYVCRHEEQQIQRIQPNRKINQVPLHGNARPHNSLCTREAIATMGWTVLPYHYA